MTKQTKRLTEEGRVDGALDVGQRVFQFLAVDVKVKLVVVVTDALRPRNKQKKQDDTPPSEDAINVILDLDSFHLFHRVVKSSQQFSVGLSLSDRVMDLRRCLLLGAAAGSGAPLWRRAGVRRRGRRPKWPGRRLAAGPGRPYPWPNPRTTHPSAALAPTNRRPKPASHRWPYRGRRKWRPNFLQTRSQMSFFQRLSLSFSIASFDISVQLWCLEPTYKSEHERANQMRGKEVLAVPTWCVWVGLSEGT